ncbi:MAG: hypothetical protein AYL29_008520 [Candidatus Bathyarchaeota archaeon B24]|nr:MAG: hypothetical protein AYL29_008520 [Candidatus Bathyarchaeota archaeon B24]
MEIDVIRYYRRLFKLPGLQTILLGHLSLGVLWGLYLGFSLDSVLKGLIAFTAVSLASDAIVYLLCKREPLLRFRRLLGLSLVSNSIVLLAGLTLSPLALLDISPERVWMAGFPLSTGLRVLVFRSLLFEGVFQILSVVQPLLCLLVIVYVYGVRLHPMVFLSMGSAALTSFIYLQLVSREAKHILGLDGLSLFRAFLSSWMENLSDPMEQVMEAVGVEGSGRLDVLAFKTGDRETAIVVPRIHPGPFRDVGGSSLPWRIQALLERRGFDAVAVPHGPSTHKENLVSKKELSKVLNALNSLNLEFHIQKASRPVRCSSGYATALSQVFGDTALVALTLSPKSMEDIPVEVGSLLEAYGGKLGFNSVIVVDAHNSILWEKTSIDDKDISLLIEAGKRALKEAAEAPLQRFKLGFSKKNVEGYGVREGLGPGGIVVHLFMFGDDLYAYVTIDGNNMVSGLREKIVQHLKTLGVRDCEVLTTDTHVVNATATGRGYHPVGEAIDQEVLLKTISEALKEAYAGLKPASAYHVKVELNGLKLLGDGLNKLLKVLDMSAKRAKRLALRFLTPALAACLLLLFL